MKTLDLTAFCNALAACCYWTQKAHNPPAIDQAHINRANRGIIA